MKKALQFIACMLIICSVILYLLWGFYLIVMTLKRARDAGTLSFPATVLGMPLVWLGVLIDAIANWTICTIIFVELPRETLVTSRLKRLILTEGWRGDMAAWFCLNLLNAFDPSGNHCK